MSHKLVFDEQEGFALLEFADPALRGAVHRMILTRANRDPLFRDLVVNAGHNLNAYRDHEARTHCYDDCDWIAPVDTNELHTEVTP